jgi:hypothetical protein
MCLGFLDYYYKFLQLSAAHERYDNDSLPGLPIRGQSSWNDQGRKYWPPNDMGHSRDWIVICSTRKGAAFYKRQANVV